MKKLLLLLLLNAWAIAGFAQISISPPPPVDDPNVPTQAPIAQRTRWQQHADSIFQHLDRSLVSTGLLTNYGFALKDYNPFQGTVLTDANLLQNLAEWRLLYTALQTSVFNGNATLPSLTMANQRLAQLRPAPQAPVPLPIATLLARYERFRDDAGPAGLVTRTGNQLYDNPNRPRSPYEQRTLVAMCPLQTGLATRTPQFSFPSQLRFTNAAPPITALEFDAGDGQGYRATTWDSAIGASYPTNGTYTLRFRLTCADGSVLLSQARLDVQQPPAARYGNTGSSGVVTQHSSTLFTDTRAYNGAAAGGTVTVAYAAGNNTGTIRKPLIVIEGYDASRALNDPTVNFTYKSFVEGFRFGGISVPYNVMNPGDKPIFNDQLSEVGQYDLIFLDYDNGTDYIQRNAYLVERLIQWVNDNKQPLNGVNQPNVVMGMSMGGLVARYALRDMEKLYDTPPTLSAYPQAYQNPRWRHDTRLYISHEAPHQGANVPLGFQYMVKSVAAIAILPGVTLGKQNPELGNFASLLDEPATQQLLIYQTDPNAAAVHQAWLNEYNQLGYPQQCRNVATSGGSECGRPQGFAPYAELLNLQGTGMLEKYNGLLNTILLTTGVGFGAIGGPLGLVIGSTVGLIFSLGNFEGHVDFVVNALPDQQQRRIYHGRFTICKDIVFGLFSTCFLDYADDNDCAASMLAYDSAPGGIYDIDILSGGALTKINSSIPVAGVRTVIQPTFCFVPTPSALDIGGGAVALGAQDLTASYVNTAPPAAPRNTPFANFISAGRENLTHITWNGLNSKWAFQEMQATPQNIACQAFCQAALTINGPTSVCSTGATFSIDGLPAGTPIEWALATNVNVPQTISTSPTFTINFSGPGGLGTLVVNITSDCGMVKVQRSIFFGTPETPDFQAQGPFDGCTENQFATFQITNYNPTAAYTVSTSGGIQLRGQIQADGTFLVKGGGSGGSITVTASNNCGTTSRQNRFSFTPCDHYTAYPNPANDEVQVQRTDAPAAQARSSSATAESGPLPGGIDTVLLYDSYGRLRLAHPGGGALAVRVPIAALPAGFYVLQVVSGGTVVNRQQLRIAR